MSQTPILSSYAELATVLNKNEPGSHPAQIHGLICGFICASTNNMEDPWEKLLPHASKNHEIKEILSQVYEGTYHQLSEFSFEFNLLLPDHDMDINIRAEALGLWSQGFLTGLAHSSIPLQKEDENIKEALDDMVEIAKINFGDIATNEEDETAYVELVEYVRLNVLMIFHELRTDPLEEPKNHGEDENTMH